MMLERFTGEARAVVVGAQQHARRLGHRYVRRRSGPAARGRLRRWRRRRLARHMVPAAGAGSGGRYAATGDQPAGHIPFTPGAKQCLHNTLREAVARHDSGIGVEHIALGLLATNRGLVPPILEEVGVSAAALRAAILDRYRSAS
jgi:ATP-dependent Clp protease ATP-binding subunit ClpC